MRRGARYEIQAKTGNCVFHGESDGEELGRRERESCRGEFVAELRERELLLQTSLDGGERDGE